MSYAEGTSVSVAKSREEIEALLLKKKAGRIGVVLESSCAIVGWSMEHRHVRFTLPLPNPDDKRFRFKDHTQAHPFQKRTQADVERLYEQECREKWRGLLLTIKAKLVSVENGVESFEQAFLAHLVLPGGDTVGQRALPALAEAYRTGKTPPLLGPGAGP